MKRNHEIRVRLSAEELDKIKKKAESCGMNISSYLRFLGLRIKQEIEEE